VCVCVRMGNANLFKSCLAFYALHRVLRVDGFILLCGNTHFKGIFEYFIHFINLDTNGVDNR